VAEVSNEMLMAYADGVLDPLKREVVERALEAHPEYREIVEKFRATAAPIRRAFLDELGSKQLDALINTVASNMAASSPPRDKGAGARSRHRALAVLALVRGRAIPAALAASVALMFGAVLGWSLHTLPAPRVRDLVVFGDSGLTAQAELRQLLETTSSGTPVTAKSADGKSWELKATYTFRTFNNGYCRRYEITRTSAVGFDGYACRAGDGQWLVQAQERLDGKPSGGKGFRPAAGRGSVGVEAAINGVMAGDALEAGQEAKLLASAWTGDR
jgi:hypothetical protein